MFESKSLEGMDALILTRDEVGVGSEAKLVAFLVALRNKSLHKMSIP